MKFGGRGKSFGRLGVISNPSFDADALALFSAMTTPPTAARKVLINAAIVSLKNGGIWPLLDIFYVTAAADSQAARLNWKNPATFTASEVNSPTFAADRGYTGDGATSRLNTGWVPSTNGVNFTQDSASMWGWSRTTGSEAISFLGNNTGTVQCMINPRTAGNAVALVRINDATNGSVSPNTDGSGFFGLQRTDSANKRVFRNGTQISTDIAQASTGVANLAQWMCGADASQFSTRQIAAAAWGAGLSGKELAFYNAMNTYMTAIGAA